MLNRFLHRGLPLICALGAVLLTVSPAFAQANIPSSGTLIAAVMEQVGYHAQGQILSTLSTYLEWLGALIYLCVIVSMIFTVSLHGSYRAALWCLVGPPIFFWASGLEIGGSKNTIAGAGVEWRFGAFDDTQVDNDKAAVIERPEVGTPSEVSFLFHKYNELISEIMQKLIKVVTNEDAKKQMIFMARQRTMEDLFSDKIVSSNIHALAAYFMVHCNVEITYARLVALGNRDEMFRNDPEYKMAKDEYCRLFPKEDKPFDPGPWQSFVFDARLWEGTNVSPEQHERFLRHDFGLVSCSMMWDWLRIAAFREITKGMEETAAHVLDKNAWKMFGSELWYQVLGEVREQLTKQENVEPGRIGPGDPCPSASGNTNDPQNFEDFEVLGNIFAGYLIRQQMLTVPAGELMSRVASGHEGFSPSGTSQILSSSPIQKEGVLRRSDAHQFSSNRRYEAFIIMTLLPYMQGVILYVLAVSYPFFAMLLLLPGKAGTFFQWMSLWAWAKSWDVGWAMIIVADEVIWTLMPKTTFINKDNPAPYTSPISLLEGAFDGDHSYTLATYWLLVSGMVTGVPVITAQAVMGAKKAIAGVMMKGITDFSDQLTAGASDFIGSQQARSYTNSRERDSTIETLGKTSEMFSNMVHQRELLASVFRSGALEDVFRGGAATRPMKGTVADLTWARAQLAARQAMEKSGIAPADNAKQMADLEKMIASAEKTLAGQRKQLETFGKDAGLRQTNQALAELEAALNLPGGELLAKAIVGESFSKSEFQLFRRREASGLITKALGSTPGSAAPELGDPTINALIDEQHSEIFQKQLEGYGHRNLAQMKLLGSVPIGGFGYGAGGSPLAGLFFKRSVDEARRSNMLGYAYQRKLAAVEMQYQTLYNDWANYEVYTTPAWLHNEYFRAHVSQNRGEWFTMSGPPNDAYWQGLHFRRDAEIDFARMRGTDQGAHQRYLLDILMLQGKAGGAP